MVSMLMRDSIRKWDAKFRYFLSHYYGISCGMTEYHFIYVPKDAIYTFNSANTLKYEPANSFSWSFSTNEPSLRRCKNTSGLQNQYSI